MKMKAEARSNTDLFFCAVGFVRFLEEIKTLTEMLNFSL